MILHDTFWSQQRGKHRPRAWRMPEGELHPYAAVLLDVPLRSNAGRPVVLKSLQHDGIYTSRIDTPLSAFPHAHNDCLRCSERCTSSLLLTEDLLM